MRRYTLDPVLDELKQLTEDGRKAEALLTAFNYIKKHEMSLNTLSKFTEYLETKVVSDGISSGKLMTNFTNL